MATIDYRLPDGRIVAVDASAAHDARWIDYTLADGRIVPAERVECEPAAHDWQRTGHRMERCLICGAINNGWGR